MPRPNLAASHNVMEEYVKPAMAHYEETINLIAPHFLTPQPLLPPDIP